MPSKDPMNRERTKMKKNLICLCVLLSCNVLMAQTFQGWLIGRPDNLDCSGWISVGVLDVTGGTVVEAEMIAWTDENPQAVVYAPGTMVGISKRNFGRFVAPMGNFRPPPNAHDTLRLVLVHDPAATNPSLLGTHSGWVAYDSTTFPPSGDMAGNTDLDCDEPELRKDKVVTIIQPIPPPIAKATGEGIKVHLTSLPDSTKDLAGIHQIGDGLICVKRGKIDGCVLGYNLYRVNASKVPPAVSTPDHYFGRDGAGEGTYLGFFSNYKGGAVGLIEQIFTDEAYPGNPKGPRPGVSYTYAVQPVFRGSRKAKWSLPPGGQSRDGWAASVAYNPGAPGSDRRILISTDSNPASLGGGSATGDIDGNNEINIGDATLALRIAMGMISPTAAQIEAGDVAPGTVMNAASRPQVFQPSGDGAITVNDAVIILKLALSYFVIGQ